MGLHKFLVATALLLIPLSTSFAQTSQGQGKAGAGAAYSDPRIVHSLQNGNNLSDLTSAATARTNLGLGTAATQPSTAFYPSTNPNSYVLVGTASGTARDAAAAIAAENSALKSTNNLSEIGSASTARTNLGLGNASIANFGTTSGTVRDALAAITAETAAQSAANAAQTSANSAQTTASNALPLAGGTVTGATSFTAGATVTNGLSVDNLTGSVTNAMATPVGAAGALSIGANLGALVGGSSQIVYGCDVTGTFSVQTCFQNIETGTKAAPANSTVNIAPGLVRVIAYPNPSNTTQNRFMWSNPTGALAINGSGATSVISTFSDNQEFYSLVGGAPYYNLTYGQNPNGSEPAPSPPAFRIDYNLSTYTNNNVSHSGVSAALKMNCAMTAGSVATNQFSDQNLSCINVGVNGADAGNANNIAIEGTYTRPPPSIAGASTSQGWGAYFQCLDDTGLISNVGGACHGVEIDVAGQNDDYAPSAPQYGLRIGAQIECYTPNADPSKNGGGPAPWVVDGTLGRCGRIMELGTHGGTSYAYAGTAIHVGGVFDSPIFDVTGGLPLSTAFLVDAGNGAAGGPGMIGSTTITLPNYENRWRVGQTFAANSYMATGTTISAVTPNAGSTEAIVTFTPALTATIPTGGATLTASSASIGLELADTQQLNFDTTHYMVGNYLGAGQQGQVTMQGPNGPLQTWFDASGQSAIYTGSGGFAVRQNGSGTGGLDVVPGAAYATVHADANGVSTPIVFTSPTSHKQSVVPTFVCTGGTCGTPTAGSSDFSGSLQITGAVTSGIMTFTDPAGHPQNMFCNFGGTNAAGPVAGGSGAWSATSNTFKVGFTSTGGYMNWQCS